MSVDHQAGAVRDPNDLPGAVEWWKAESGRWEQDRHEITDRFPDLVWTAAPARAIRDAGGWSGRLPMWPFDRPQPVGVDRLGLGLQLELIYPQAYPMVPAAVHPQDPAPDLVHRTDHRWHLNGDGSLCLLRAAAQWDPRTSVIDLLLKAAGWRIEFALMKAGIVDAMSESGIVSDDSLDSLLTALPTIDVVPPAGPA